VTDVSPSSKTRWKVPFEWTEELSLLDGGMDRDVSWSDAETDERFQAVVFDSLFSSLDISDIARVTSLGVAEAARTVLASVPGWGCTWRTGWWKLLNYRSEPVGFVLPVTYDDTFRGGRPLGTIFHIGVVPAFRGYGFGRLLLRDATRTLMSNGAYRIFCDTDVTNAPMIHLFESEGWRRLPDRAVPLTAF
jgi:ribosomal protein S18 acetylase RimI-like enzyme